LQDLDSFESLYRMTNGKVNHLLALIRELVIKREISFERIAKRIALNIIPTWKLFLNMPNGQQMNIEEQETEEKKEIHRICKRYL
jgi:hypothetical protein